MKTYTKILLVVLSSSQILSCKDDESPSSQFKILNSSSSFDAINNCTLPSAGSKGTSFNFDFILQAADASAIVDRIIFDVLWENGDSQKNIEKDNFTLVDNVLTFEQCGRFVNSEWFELTVRVIDENNVESNSIKLKVTRPDGAN